MRNKLNSLNQSVPQASINTNPNSAFHTLLNTGELNGDESFQFLLQKIATCSGIEFGINSINSVQVSLAGNSATYDPDLKMLTQGRLEWSEQVVFSKNYLGLRRRSDEFGRGLLFPRAGPLFSTTGVTYGIPDGS